jgi:hypothetical protein
LTVDDWLAVREATSEDMPFVLRSWLASYRYGHPKQLRRPVCEYTRDQVRRIGGLIDGGACVHVACWVHGPSLVVGWICRERAKPVVHYVYTKRWYRRCGVASTLIGALVDAPVVYTHRTRTARRIAPEQWTYEPMRATT